jgi:hypothetical protein
MESKNICLAFVSDKEKTLNKYMYWSNANTFELMSATLHAPHIHCVISLYTVI